MYVNGIGTLFFRGVGIEKFEEALNGEWVEPTYAGDGKKPSYQADFTGSKYQSLLKKIRRADRTSKMSVIAAADAIANSRLDDIEPERMGVILSTAYGPHVTTFKFLDDILDYGEDGVSPTIFSNSVHNAASSYVAETLKIQGPTLTVTQFFHSFYHAMLLAKLWLGDKRVDHVLVGAVDQYGEVLDYIYDRKLTTAPDGKIKPFNLSPTCQVPGEGAAFFLVGDSRAENSYCRVDDIFPGWDNAPYEKPDMYIIDSDGMMPDESAYSVCKDSDTPIAAYSPLFGSMMAGSAFNFAAGALTLKNGRSFPNPVTQNPHNLNIIEDDLPKVIERVSCFRYNCQGEVMGAHLSKI